MDSFDTKLAHSNTSWWITSLAISVVCCAVLFVLFASYLFQIKEDLAVGKVRSDLTESRLNEISMEIQMLNRRSSVQQIQIIPAAPAAPQAGVPTSSAVEPITPAIAAAAAAAALNPPSAQPAPQNAASQVPSAVSPQLASPAVAPQAPASPGTP